MDLSAPFFDFCFFFLLLTFSLSTAAANNGKILWCISSRGILPKTATKINVRLDCRSIPLVALSQINSYKFPLQTFDEFQNNTFFHCRRVRVWWKILNISMHLILVGISFVIFRFGGRSIYLVIRRVSGHPSSDGASSNGWRSTREKTVENQKEETKW